MPFVADKQMPNLCGDCSVCVDRCPVNALTLEPFKDHPENREDVLDIETCKGDKGCIVCLQVCPWEIQKL